MRSARCTGCGSLRLAVLASIAFAILAAAVPLLSGCRGHAEAKAEASPGWRVQSQKDRGYEFTAVTFADKLHGWVAGSAGAVYATTDGGSTWTPRGAVSGTAQWDSIACVGTDRVWVAGGHSEASDRSLCAIYATSDGGAHWRAQELSTRGWLYAITFVDGQRGWAVGAAGSPSERPLILATRDGGAHWSAQHANVPDCLYAVDFVDSSHGWAVGYNTDAQSGVILATSDGGVHWETQVSGDAYLGAGSVAFVDPDHGWVATSGAIAVTTDGGRHWLRRRTVAMEYPGVLGVTFVDRAHGWAVGGGGPSTTRDAIWATGDGGSHWSLQDAGTFEGLNAVTATDRSHAWAVGEGQLIVATASGGRGSSPSRTYASKVLPYAPPKKWVKVVTLKGPGSVGDVPVELKGGCVKLVWGPHDKSVIVHVVTDTGTLTNWHSVGDRTSDMESLGAGRCTLAVESKGDWSVTLYELR